MAMIVCPECGKSFSDHASACPNCSCPTEVITGQAPTVTNSNTENILLLADRAFSNSEYKEAASYYKSAFLTDAKNAHTLLRLELSTFAANVPSVRTAPNQFDTFVDALLLYKRSAPEQFEQKVISFLTDTQKVVEDVALALYNLLDDADASLSHMRSRFSMIADFVSTPAFIANQNFKKDIETANQNSIKLDNANKIAEGSIAELSHLTDNVLEAVAKVFGDDKVSSDSLAESLKFTVNDYEHNVIYKRLTGKDASKDVSFGLCVGDKTTLYNGKNIAQLKSNGKKYSSTLDPAGYLRITNFDIDFTSKNNNPSKNFHRCLNDFYSYEDKPGTMFYTLVINFKNGDELIIKHSPSSLEPKEAADFNKFINLLDAKNTHSSEPSREYPSAPATNASKPSSGGGCYVATAVYGSYDCPEVWTLRRYRDNTLAKTWYGRAFIRTYYAISPTLVKWFGDTSWFKKLWKGNLDRMIKNLQAQGYDSTPYEDKKW